MIPETRKPQDESRGLVQHLFGGVFPYWARIALGASISNVVVNVPVCGSPLPRRRYIFCPISESAPASETTTATAAASQH